MLRKALLLVGLLPACTTTAPRVPTAREKALEERCKKAEERELQLETELALMRSTPRDDDSLCAPKDCD